MTKKTRRRLIPCIVLLAAVGVLAAVVFGPDRSPSNTITNPSKELPKKESPTVVPQVTQEDTTQKTTEKTPEIIPTKRVTGKLSLQLYLDNTVPATLGSLDDPATAKMEVELSRSGAGIKSIRFSDIFETVDGKLAWNKYRKDRGEIPSIDEMYLLCETHELSYNPKNAGSWRISNIK